MSRGQTEALDALLPLVYDELTALARRQRRRWHGDLTLNTTALVHEAFLKLARLHEFPAESRSHFFAVAARAMRHILCNHARDRRRKKRGGEVRHVTFSATAESRLALDIGDDHSELLEKLDDALHGLEQIAARHARVVECRFFGGMSVSETAAALGISERTVKRDWSFARAWLLREMNVRVDPRGDG